MIEVQVAVACCGQMSVNFVVVKPLKAHRPKARKPHLVAVK